ncbi:MAG: hypothetical protein M3115_00610 [Thermoproteota archaeon]|nr:hypothetical protein [Thermoproteota archaeon]
MSTAKDDDTNDQSQDVGKEEFPPVPEAAIVKPEDERPTKMQMRPEENVGEGETNSESSDTASEDMDGDGSPDWSSQ